MPKKTTKKSQGATKVKLQKIPPTQQDPNQLTNLMRDVEPTPNVQLYPQKKVTKEKALHTLAGQLVILK